MSIDDKVVNMSFEQGKFAAGVNDTIHVLDKLKDSLKFPDAGKGLENVDKAANKVTLGHIATAVDGLASKFGALNVAALAVFSSIAIHAAQSAAAMAKSFTIGPIIQGFQEYSTNLNAVQTILANTEASGATLKDVNAALLDLNKYSDKTIYNFSQMAKNIGTFTAAGVDLKTATGAIKGIANLAALSGSNAEQASTAMYQLSQAISAGRVSLQDWNSVVNAGMGGTVFQRALATTAVSMGKLKDSSLKLVGPMKNVSIAGQSFRQSIQSGPGKVSWLTSDVLTKTLQQFTGDLTNAQLKAQGFNDAQIKAIQATAKTAQHAATEVKTITQVFDVAKETMGSGWAQTFQLIFGNFGEAKKTFTALSNAINGFINASARARNKVLKDWKALGGRTVLIDSIKTAFHNLGLILKPIKEAFRDIFPRKTGQQLYDLTLRFQDFANALKPSDRTLVNLRNTFQGVFAIFDIGKQVLVGIITLFGHLFKSAGVGNGGILDLTGGVGNLLFNFDKALKKGNQIEHFFAKLGDVLSVPLKVLDQLASKIGILFYRFSPGGFSDATKVMTAAIEHLQVAIGKVHNIWTTFVDSVQNATSLQAIFEGISNFFQNLGPGIGKAIANVNWEVVLSAIRTGLFAGLLLLFKNFFGRGAAIDQIFQGLGFGKVIKKNIAGALGTLTGSMKSMQNNIRAKTLKEIAIAIALLTASVVALSFVDPKKLNSALTALTIMFGELIGAMKLLEKATSSAGFVKLPIMIASLVLLAGAIDLLTIAVYALSRLSWERLAKGLGSIGFLLAAISAASFALSKNSAGLIRAGIAINILAVGLNILAIAVAKFGAMDIKTLGKGLIGVAAGLDILQVALQRFPKRGGLIGAAAVVVLAEGLKILADAVLKFGRMDLKVMAKGLIGIGVALTFISEALRRMPWNSLSKSAGLLVLAYGLNEMSKALRTMGGMSVGEIAKSLVTLSVSLDILSIALHNMRGTLRGSAALGIAAAGLALLVPSLVLLGKQSWTTIVKGLTSLAATLIVLGGAAKLLQPAIPALLGFGAAMVLVGAGMALAGAGILAVGLGLSAIAVAGPTAIAILQQAMIEMSKALPEIMKNLVLALLAFVQALAKTAPQFVAAVVVILGQLLDAIIKLTPKLVKAIGVVLRAILKVFYAHKDEIIQAGIDLILSLLDGIRRNIGKAISLAAQVIINFINGIASKLGNIIDAGVNIIVSLVKGIKKGLLKIIDETAKAIVSFLNGVADAIEKYEPQIIVAWARIGEAIVKGLIKGIGDLAPKLRDKIEDLIKSLPKKALSILGINSPSKVFHEIGQGIVEGLHDGLAQHQDAVKAVNLMSDNVINAVKEKFNMRSPSKVMEQIGKDINEGFARGLRSSASDVKQVFTDMNDELLSAASDARDAIANENKNIAGYGDTLKQQQAKLKELEKNPKKNAAAIKEAVKAIKQTTATIAESSKTIEENQHILSRTTAAHIELTKGLKEEKAELLDLSKGYEQVSAKLDAARQALVDAKQTRKDAFTEYRDQYGTLPDISATDAEGNAQNQLDAYEKALTDQITAIKAYHKTLAGLRKLGLDDTTYKKLLADGTVDQKFADELLAGGKTAVTQLNDLDKKLGKSSADLAHEAASQLYDAGVAAAQGLVDGLRSKKSDLASSISFLAKEIIGEMKKSLGIKSPSTIFADIGRQTTQGLAKGLIESSKSVTDAVYMVSNDAMGAMSTSLSKVSDLVTDSIDPNPTITPVLDLSQIRKDANEVGKMIGIPAITPTVSSAQAASIALANSSRISVEDIPPAVSGLPPIKIEQNNYSPESLDTMEIYRRTKTQFSQLRALTR